MCVYIYIIIKIIMLILTYTYIYIYIFIGFQSHGGTPKWKPHSLGYFCDCFPFICLAARSLFGGFHKWGILKNGWFDIIILMIIHIYIYGFLHSKYYYCWLLYHISPYYNGKSYTNMEDLEVPPWRRNLSDEKIHGDSVDDFNFGDV